MSVCTLRMRACTDVLGVSSGWVDVYIYARLSCSRMCYIMLCMYDCCVYLCAECYVCVFYYLCMLGYVRMYVCM